MRGGVQLLDADGGTWNPQSPDEVQPRRGLYLFDDGLLMIGHGDFRFGNPDCWWVPIADVDRVFTAEAGPTARRTILTWLAVTTKRRGDTRFPVGSWIAAGLVQAWLDARRAGTTPTTEVMKLPPPAPAATELQSSPAPMTVAAPTALPDPYRRGVEGIAGAQRGPGGAPLPRHRWPWRALGDVETIEAGGVYLVPGTNMPGCAASIAMIAAAGVPALVLFVLVVMGVLPELGCWAAGAWVLGAFAVAAWYTRREEKKATEDHGLYVFPSALLLWSRYRGRLRLIPKASIVAIRNVQTAGTSSTHADVRRPDGTIEDVQLCYAERAAMLQSWLQRDGPIG